MSGERCKGINEVEEVDWGSSARNGRSGCTCITEGGLGRRKERQNGGMGGC